MGKSILHWENGLTGTKMHPHVGGHVPRIQGNLSEFVFHHYLGRSIHQFAPNSTKIHKYLFRSAFHISQVIIFHITPHHFYISQRCQAVQKWPFCTKMTLNSNSSQCSPILGLFHSAVPKSEQIYSVLAPKNCKSAHNLAHPSRKRTTNCRQLA